MLHLPHPFIVPGGRFREMYYWDTYWVLRGLLRCGMHATARGILSNFAHLIGAHGMVPNGNRTYYLGRSQPPLLAQMVRDYVDATGDADFVGEILPYLETEYRYWRDRHAVTVLLGDGQEHIMFRCAINQPHT